MQSVTKSERTPERFHRHHDGGMSGRPIRLARLALLLVALCASLGAAPEARAHCDAALLCPGSGACTITGTSKIDNGCNLDFKGRDVTLTGTLDIDGNAVTIQARNFTVASSGKIDGNPQGGLITIVAGGSIAVQSSNPQRGIDVVGQAQGGSIILDALANITIDGRLKANNASGALETSGGSIDLRAGGNLRIGGTSDVDASGGKFADGGSIDLLAVGRLDIEKDISVAGGEGGDASLEAGDEVSLTGRIVDDSIGGGGGGGFVDITGGKTVTVAKSIRSTGSTSADDFGGDGGFLAIASTRGDVIVRDEIIVAGGQPDGGGGEIELSAGRSVKIQAGRLNTRGEGIDSFAGSVFLDGDLDVVVGAVIDASGGSEGGEIELAAGRNAEIASTLDVRARQAATFSGSVIVDAGLLGGGAVTVKAAGGKILAMGAGCSGTFCSIAGTIDLNACDVTVESAPATLDASAAGITGAGGAITVVARRQLAIRGPLDATGFGSQGTIDLVYPKSGSVTLTGPITPSAGKTECTQADCAANRACRSLCLDFCDCGDAMLDEFEQCDSSAQGCGEGEVCGVTGTVKECICIATCGNNAVDVGEECDGAQGGSTCRTLGFVNDSPVPCVSCGFDTTQCDEGSCGDNTLAPRNELDEKGLPGFFEVCDGADVGAESCVSLGYTRGTLACKADCSGFNVSGCQIGVCGDNVVDAGEECDAGNANSTAPNAPCRPGCQLPRCGDGITDTALGEECDDANKNDNDRCLNGCFRARCGDGVLCSSASCTTGPTGGPEQCDAAATCCLSTCARRPCADGQTCGNLGNNGCCHPDASCDDGDPCTTDSVCNLITGCTHSPRANCCSTFTDARCNDNNPCTTDQCNLDTFLCEHTPNTLPCNDGNACTTGDVCAGGTCGGTTLTCIAPDACREVVGCNPASGCQFRFIVDCCAGDGAACDDGDVCTGGDTCDGLTCGGAPIACLSGDPCQEPDGCDPVTGCKFRPIPGCCTENADCADDDACTTERCNTATRQCENEQIQCVTTDECLAVTGCDPQAGCQTERVNGTVGLDCLMAREVLALGTEVPAKESDLGSKLVKQLGKYLNKAKKKIEKGRKFAGDPKKAAKAAKQLTAADKQLAKFLKKLENVDPQVAAPLIELVGFIREQLGRAL